MNILKQIIKVVSSKLNPNRCKCSEIPIKDYPTAYDGKVIQLLSGEWVALSSLPYTAPERFKCPHEFCLLYTSPSPRDQRGSRMPSSA